MICNQEVLTTIYEKNGKKGFVNDPMPGDDRVCFETRRETGYRSDRVSVHNPDTIGYADPYKYAVSDQYADPYRYADAHKHADPYKYADADEHTDAYKYADPYEYEYTNSDKESEGHKYTYADEHAHTYAGYRAENAYGYIIRNAGTFKWSRPYIDLRNRKS